ncbi:NAD(P)/FAD-dependent oxidoreductase [Sinorhizobium sp. RAC02]|uniref:FAD-dependent oxidoreductase n=1 Tax=Sinorhizobium sp. RAC02 TaxID=1842534 RepID=UPI00083D7005|nr:NAD(P)/FAD-dependent oxidoreductase [Sinorhizobium sp. RAC02]AOF91318.1 pyridine nucleotide-disulfide oxidoreductase family protein [Sinorhizobium sp. RAC02]
MSSEHTAKPENTKPGAEIAVVGGGLAGTLAAYLLGRAGHAVTLIDRHRSFPRTFRSEKLGPGEIEVFKRFGLSAAIAARAVSYDETVNMRRGQVVDRTHARHFGILYHDLIEAIRAEMPQGVRFVQGQVREVKAGARRQRIAIVGHEEVTARLLVLATGTGDTLRRDLGISRRIIRPRQSVAFGFNLCPTSAGGFRHTAVTLYGERVSDGIDYLSLFPVAGAIRANLFVYRDRGDSWVRALRERPKDTLGAAFPGLAGAIGDFEVEGPVDSWITDIAVAENYRQDGVVLVGDAFQTTCPATGTGVARLLNDVERLCGSYVPRWTGHNVMTAADLATFYDDAEKRRMDAYALAMADFRRRLTIGTEMEWRLRRQHHFALRRVVNGIDRLSPALVGRLRQLWGSQSRHNVPSAV